MPTHVVSKYVLAVAVRPKESVTVIEALYVWLDWRPDQETFLFDDEPVMTRLPETFVPFTTRPIALLLMVKPLGERALNETPSAGLTKIMFNGKRLLMTGGIGPLT